MGEMEAVCISPVIPGKHKNNFYIYGRKVSVIILATVSEHVLYMYYPFHIWPNLIVNRDS